MAAFQSGLKFAASGSYQDAAKEFRQAIKTDPDFSEAHGNLGVEDTALGDFEKAAAEFRRAIELDPATAAHHSNLAYALVRMGREREAEPEAQTAVTLDPSDTRAQYILGFLFAQRPETRKEAVAHLVYAARELPDAHFILAELYLDQGSAAVAKRELEQYRQAVLVIGPVPGGGK